MVFAAHYTAGSASRRSKKDKAQTTDNEGLIRLQTIAAWIMLAIVLLSALALGGNRPVTWTFMGLSILALSLLHILLSILGAPSKTSPSLKVAAALYVTVPIWALLQALPIMPDILWHPFFALVETDRGAISAAPWRSLHMGLRAVVYGLVFAIIMAAATNHHKALRFFQVIGLYSSGLALFGILAYLSGSNPILGEAFQSGSLSASFVNRNSYATYAGFGSIVNLAVYLHLADDRFQAPDRTFLVKLRDGLEQFLAGGWLYFLGFILCTGAVVLTQSRAGAMSALFGLVIFALLHGRKGQRANGATLWSVIGGVVVFLGVFASTGLMRRLLATSEEDGRFAIYPSVIEGIFDRPVLGHGYGAFLDAFRPLVPVDAATSREWDMAHSSYLENAFELGIPVAAALYVSLGIIAYRLYRGAIDRRRNRIFPCAAFACLCTGGLHSAFDFSLQMPATAALFACILGIGWAQSFPSRKR